jgi:hypothetical protein
MFKMILPSNVSAKIHKSCSEPILMWKAALQFPEKMDMFAFLARLTTLPLVESQSTCVYCGLIQHDELIHFFCSCHALQKQREQVWNVIFQLYSIHLEVELHNLTDDNFVCAMLGAQLDSFKSDASHLQFLKTCAKIWYVTNNDIYANQSK